MATTSRSSTSAAWSAWGHGSAPARFGSGSRRATRPASTTSGTSKATSSPSTTRSEWPSRWCASRRGLPMRFDYSKWKGPRPEDLQFLRQLMDIYRNLLLQTGGDVDEALRWMEHFGQQYGFFNEQFGLADFKKLLEQSGEVERTPKGFKVTPKGEKRIRQDSLNEIFTTLQAGAAGDHRTPVAAKGGERLSETRPYQSADNLSHRDPLPSTSTATPTHGVD